MPIEILSANVASQIAAGEVVERPSSVVKELVENAIDAEARDIRIEVKAGGKAFIRVTDDGCGIPTDEVALAFHRHSTSKLSTADDLTHITTLGFRGEALASIAAVSRVTIVTRAEGEGVGTLMRIEGGEVAASQPSGRAPGTTITVEDLFYNVPARRKFLRTDLTERRHIDNWVTRYAIAYSGLRFTLIHGEREYFRSPGTGELRDVLVSIHGPEIGEKLLPVLPAAGQARPILVSGYVAPPSVHRSNRSDIDLFVNGRWVQDRRLTWAVIQAYHTFLPTGRYPLAVVMVNLAPEDVDVNVHPAKVEVRFQDGDAVFRAVQRAVRQALVAQAPVPSAGVGRGQSAAWTGHDRQFRRLPVPDSGGDAPLVQPALGLDERPGGLPPLRVVGQVSATYVVTEGPDGLYLIDQHAAHERVLYEQMMAQHKAEEDVVSQRLLEPVAVEVPPQMTALVTESLDVLNGFGFEVAPFGGNTFLIRALPVILAQAQPDEILLEVTEALEGVRSRVEEEVEEAIVRGICKRAAVKAGQVLTRDEMEELIRGLERSVSPRTCPHGRPTMIRLSVDQLAREFGRQ